MKKLFVILFLALVIPAPARASSPFTWAKETIQVVNMEFDLSRHPREKEVRLWLPYPVSNQWQDISAVRVKTDADESAVYGEKRYHNTILYARWDRGAKSRHLSLSFKARRIAAQRLDFPKKEGAWNRNNFAQWLAPTSLGPITGQVAELASKITGSKKTVLAKAKAIYDWTCENMYRDPKTKGCGKGDVCALLAVPGGKCTDIHSVFVALCRAAGVPAREIFGVRLGKKARTDITGWQHCWAEFYLPGYGWVPVDPADVRKLMLKQKLSLDDPATEELCRYFWGRWDAFRIKLSRGRDLILNPPQSGMPLNTFGYPYAEAGGRPLDFYDPASFTYRINSGLPPAEQAINNHS